VNLGRRLLAACVTLMIAGCGGSGAGGPRLTHDLFARKMESICRQQNARLKDVHRGDPASDRRWVDAARDALKQIERLNPPERDEERLRDAFAHWSKGVDYLQDLVHALETNNPAMETPRSAVWLWRFERSRG
jgi:hypothetical protein